MFRKIVIPSYVVAVLGMTVAARAQQVQCPVISGSGTVRSDGTVYVLGQLAVGTVSGGGIELQQGAVPCWLAGSPPATGACCLKGGSCEDDLTEQQCADKEGVKWEEGSACEDVDCPKEGCSGEEAFTKVACKVNRRTGKVKKVIVKVKKATPLAKYKATLESGQTLEKTAKKSGKATFKFTGGNKPECGENGVTLSTGGEDCVSKAFDCGC